MYLTKGVSLEQQYLCDVNKDEHKLEKKKQKTLLFLHLYEVFVDFGQHAWWMVSCCLCSNRNKESMGGRLKVLTYTVMVNQRYHENVGLPEVG